MATVSAPGAAAFNIGPGPSRFNNQMAALMRQPSPGWGSAVNKIASAFILHRQKEQERQEKMQREATRQVTRGNVMRQLRDGGDVRAALIANPAILGDREFMSALSSLRKPEAPETFEPVDSPYGRGGFGQRSSKTGRIYDYQGPDEPEGPTDETRRVTEWLGRNPGKTEADYWSMKRHPGTTVNLPGAAAGHEYWLGETERIEAIPEAERTPAQRRRLTVAKHNLPLAEVEASAAKAAGRATEESKRRDIATVHIDAIRNAVKGQGLFTPITGMGGSVAQDIPGTAAHDVQQRIMTLKSMVALDTLQQMRNNSPTGGAMGQVSDRDIALLEASVASLEQSQSEGQFLKNLDLFERTLSETVHGRPGARGGGTPSLPDVPGLPATRDPESIVRALEAGTMTLGDLNRTAPHLWGPVRAILERNAGMAGRG